MLFTQAQIFAQNGHSITIQKANISVVDALKAVEKQSKMSINFSDSDLKSKTIKQLDLQKVSVDKALSTILKNTGFVYKIQGNYVIVTSEAPAGKKGYQENQGTGKGRKR